MTGTHRALLVGAVCSLVLGVIAGVVPTQRAAAAPGSKTTAGATGPRFPLSVPASTPICKATKKTHHASVRPRSTTSAKASAASTSMPVGVAFGDYLGGLCPAALDSALDDVVALRATWIRVDFSWTRIQPTSRDAWSWDRSDRVVAAARARGLKVIALLTYSPAWARASTCQNWRCPPSNPADFGRFATAVAQRYRTSGLDTFEIWNEPNITAFWTNPDPNVYRQVLSSAISGIRAASPSARVLFGGLAPVGTSNGNYSAGAFLSAVCSSGGCAGVDAVSYHPYTAPYLATTATTWRTAWERITFDTGWQESLRHVLTDQGMASTPIWVTEFGAPTGGKGTRVAAVPSAYTLADHVTEALQSQIVASGFVAARSTPLVGGLFVHTGRDTKIYGGDREDFFGLTRVNGSRKPSWYAFRDAAAKVG